MTNNIVEANLLRLKQEIVPYTPKIIAVTKYYDKDAILDAYSAGLRDFGESRVIDAVNKIESLPSSVKNDSKFHFIGHLQTNKVDKVVQHFDCIQSVDSLRLAKLISVSAEKYGKVQEILLQVNITEEEQKFGFSIQELKESFSELTKLSYLKISGLMCMATLGADEEELDSIFTRARELLFYLNEANGTQMRELSMGMSDDYKRAVVNGATMIRIGRLLFK